MKFQSSPHHLIAQVKSIVLDLHHKTALQHSPAQLKKLGICFKLNDKTKNIDIKWFYTALLQ